MIKHHNTAVLGIRHINISVRRHAQILGLYKAGDSQVLPGDAAGGYIGGRCHYHIFTIVIIVGVIGQVFRLYRHSRGSDQQHAGQQGVKRSFDHISLLHMLSLLNPSYPM